MAVLVNILGEAVKCGKVKSTGVFYELLKIMEDLLLRPPSQRTHPSRKLILLNLPTGYGKTRFCLLYTSPSPRDRQKSRMPSSA